MDRRQFVTGVLASPFVAAGPARAAEPIPIGDMHFHLLFFGPRPASKQPLGPNMAEGGATLVSWSLVADVPWLALGRGGFTQKGSPERGEAAAWFREDLQRIKAHISEQGLKIVHAAEDIDRALGGEAHVVLSSEGATFADEDPAEIAAAYALGLRQLQIVHYIKSPMGDFQTERPVHNGLTDLGKTVVSECNRLGMLVDLAHCTSAGVRDALEISKVPVVWSHSSVVRYGTPHWSMPAWQARQLRYEDAKAIADGGGVIGLWALGADVGRTAESYAGRLLEMADWLGEDHVAFGTDMNALSRPAIARYADLRRVVEILAKRGVPERKIRKLAIENFARVLKGAFAARET